MVEERTMTLAEVEREIARLSGERAGMWIAVKAFTARAGYLTDPARLREELLDVIMDAYHQPLADLEAERDSILLEMEQRR